MNLHLSVEEVTALAQVSARVNVIPIAVLVRFSMYVYAYIVDLLIFINE